MLAVGIFFALYGLRYRLFDADGAIGPGVVPVVAGVAVAVIAATLLIRIARQARRQPQTAAASAPVKKEPMLADLADEGAAGRPVTVVGILGLLGVVAGFAPLFGLIPMLSAMVFVLVFVFEREGFVAAISLAVGSGVVCWVAFGRLFEVRLPVGSVWAALGF